MTRPHGHLKKALIARYLLAMILPVLASSAHAQVQPKTDRTPANYIIRVLDISPPRLSVTALLPIDGDKLEMQTARPGDVPEILKQGWPALVAGLEVTDEAGARVQANAAGPAGWQLERKLRGRATVKYDVDYSLLLKDGWPALREAAYQDADHIVAIGRSIFVTTGAVRESSVEFQLPSGWHATVPWRKGTDGNFQAHSAEDLTENLCVLSRSGTDTFSVNGFRLSVTSIGRWFDVRPEVRRVLGAVTEQFVRLMRSKEEMNYSVVLLPAPENGGESFRSSFALTREAPPTRENSDQWGNMIAHEIFHLWNGWRLRGADYPSTQWFQEGFTEYAANISMVNAGLVTPDRFREKLATHVQNYRRLKTSLTGSGTHKGPPLYSGGALVAFSWDVILRHETQGKRGLGDFMRALWRQTGSGERPYSWSDLRAALTSIAPYDWDGFYRKYIDGIERLPLAELFTLADLSLSEQADGTVSVNRDPTATQAAKTTWSSLVKEQSR